MEIFETFATVESQGRVLVAGVPFAPGTQVEVTISARVTPARGTEAPDDAEIVSARQQMQELFRTVRGFRIGQRIPREELYDRGSVR